MPSLIICPHCQQEIDLAKQTRETRRFRNFLRLQGCDPVLWRPLPSDGRFAVSIDGRIFNLDHYRPRKLTLVKYGRDKCLAFKVGANLMLHVHRVVAATWLHDFRPELLVHHRDGNIFNNRADNLQVVTHKEHMTLHKAIRAEKKRIIQK